MDTLVRSRRALLNATAFALLLIACAANHAEPVGFSHSNVNASTTRTDAGTKINSNLLPPDFRTTFVHIEHVNTSEHALGRFDSDVFVNDTQTETSVRSHLNSDTGAIVVETLHDKKTNQSGPTYIMKKTDAGWQFYALDETANVILDDHTSVATRDLCKRCHADAPHDGIF